MTCSHSYLKRKIAKNTQQWSSNYVIHRSNVLSFWSNMVARWMTWLRESDRALSCTSPSKAIAMRWPLSYSLRKWPSWQVKTVKTVTFSITLLRISSSTLSLSRCCRKSKRNSKANSDWWPKKRTIQGRHPCIATSSFWERNLTIIGSSMLSISTMTLELIWHAFWPKQSKALSKLCQFMPHSFSMTSQHELVWPNIWRKRPSSSSSKEVLASQCMTSC